MHNEHRRREFVFVDKEEFIALQAPSYDRSFRFCRMFPRDQTKALIALGKAMERQDDVGNSPIPAGYTYLMQFVNHDITFDKTLDAPPDSLSVDEIEQGRAPSLVLDSIYGRGPDHSRELYGRDKIRFRLGHTIPLNRFGVNKAYPNDLPRYGPSHRNPRQAVIANPLNDQNLILAQTHVAFLKFHNAVVDSLQGQIDDKHLFQEARKCVVQHYQSIVLHDALPRFVDETIYKKVLEKGRRIFYPERVTTGTKPSLPLEFAFAAFRFGHSIVRNRYSWNDLHSQSGRRGDAILTELFRMTGFSGDLGEYDSLLSEWIIDWHRFYDIHKSGETPHPQLNFAHVIDTSVASYLQKHPGFVHEGKRAESLLAVQDLLRGEAVGLPTGQEIALMMADRDMKVDTLSPAQIASSPGEQATLVKQFGFDTHTPLWYYILQEAKIQQKGKRLGLIGSRIVVETLHALIEASPWSILDRAQSWRPELPSQALDRFTMPDLLRFIDKHSAQNELNPLADS